MKPLVSISCTAYNHAQFIRQCLDGFVMQKATFHFEVLIHDDASTDGTQDIIREYEVKYPEIIKPIYQKVNQYSKGIPIGVTFNMPRAQGKYIALCEGDDYWTDPYKLQKQVDFLENHPDYVMCSHKWDEFLEGKEEMTYGNPTYVNQEGETYDLNDFVHGKWCCQPLTVVFKQEALDMQYYSQYKRAKDITLFYALLKHGKGYCFPDVMATYRIHSKGIWSGLDVGGRRLQDFRAKMEIYELEQSKEAATFILLEFNREISRKWVLKQEKLLWKVGLILSKYFGILFTLKLYFKRFILNRIFFFQSYS